jgi:hypothetical protein
MCLVVAGGMFSCACVQHLWLCVFGIAEVPATEREGVSLVYSPFIASDTLHKSIFSIFTVRILLVRLAVTSVWRDIRRS